MVRVTASATPNRDAQERRPSSLSESRSRGLPLFLRYRIVTLTIAVGAVGAGLYLAGLANLARWGFGGYAVLFALIATVGIVQQLRRRRFGVDILAVIAIVATVTVGEVIAAMIIVLMVSGGKALEDFVVGVDDDVHAFTLRREHVRNRHGTFGPACRHGAARTLELDHHLGDHEREEPDMTATTVRTARPSTVATPNIQTPDSALPTGRPALAILRLATGFIFLWAFLDKTFGLGFSTPVERAWINGGTPSQGFLLSDSVTGPLQPFFASIASSASDVLFMLGMLGIGIAVMLGIGLRVSAVAGTVIMVLMYLAEWPFTAGTGSTNPAVDYHIIYALALIVVAATAAGDTWGLGTWWKKLPIVRTLTWLR